MRLDYNVTMYLRADAFRQKLSEELSGNGMELGPGQICFEARNAQSVLLVDKLPSDLHKELFPELGPDVQIVEPDLLIDFDSHGLDSIPENQFDFIIASHLLEHLAQPFRVLDAIWHKLKLGGVCVLFLPDRRRTFDRNRTCPPFNHFLREYLENSKLVNEVDLHDYLLKVENYSWDGKMNDFVERHLARSIHVHAWTDHEFVNILSQIQQFSEFRFELTDGISSSMNPNFEEFGLVLKKIESTDDCSDIRSSWSELINVSNYEEGNFITTLLIQVKNFSRKYLRYFRPR